MILPLSQVTFTREQLPPEILLQVLAARVKLGVDDAARTKALLRGEIIWPDILTYAGKLGVQPLLYKHLSQNESSQHVPAAVLDFLEDAYRKHSLRNLRVYGLIERLLSTFEEAGIAVVPLKGAFLARWIYHDIALRPMGDIDILCREEEEGRVRAKLAGLGFHQGSMYSSRYHERFFAIDKGGHLSPFYASNALMIELHFSIFPDVPHGFSHMGRVWDRVGHCTTDGLSVSCLDPADLLLYLCLHLQRHLRFGQCRLYWFCDIHEVAAHYQDTIEWDRLFSSAASFGLTDEVRSILRLVSRYWHSSVPETQGHFKELSLAIILRKELLLSLEESQKAIIRGQFDKLNMLGEMPGWRNRTYFFWRLVFPSRENLISRYQPRSSLTLFLFVLLHPLVLIKRAMVSLFYHVSCHFRE